MTCREETRAHCKFTALSFGDLAWDLLLPNENKVDKGFFPDQLTASYKPCNFYLQVGPLNFKEPLSQTSACPMAV